ncbi:uncharacterized protein PSFLO_01544 [Pseudozyma flocculosa]|uniref:Uncharacterized protein n=1 Tax=Pseudozyma flocculosa TaxID=84751 RepID=A0A5C3EUX9_9BASI|nr:uncharacterized protein PSFLO_01544 [Pseudozyma flocculosa]
MAWHWPGLSAPLRPGAARRGPKRACGPPPSARIIAHRSTPYRTSLARSLPSSPAPPPESIPPPLALPPASARRLPACKPWVPAWSLPPAWPSWPALAPPCRPGARASPRSLAPHPVPSPRTYRPFGTGQAHPSAAAAAAAAVVRPSLGPLACPCPHPLLLPLLLLTGGPTSHIPVVVVAVVVAVAVPVAVHLRADPPPPCPEASGCRSISLVSPLRPLSVVYLFLRRAPLAVRCLAVAPSQPPAVNFGSGRSCPPPSPSSPPSLTSVPALPLLDTERPHPPLVHLVLRRSQT